MGAGTVKFVIQFIALLMVCSSMQGAIDPYKKNVLTTNIFVLGTNLTLNGGVLESSSGGSALWSSAGGVLYPFPAVDVVRIESQLADNSTNVALVVDTSVPWSGTAALADFRNDTLSKLFVGAAHVLINTNAQYDKESFGGQFVVPGNGVWNVPMYFKAVSTNLSNEFFAGVVRFNLEGSTSGGGVNDSEGLAMNHNLYVADEGAPFNQAIEGGDAAYALVGRMDGGIVATTNLSQSAGVWGNNSRSGPYNYGVVGNATSLSYTNIGIAIAGVAFMNAGTNRTSVALYGELNDAGLGGAARVMENSVLVLDNRNTGLPLIVARTNNGTMQFKLWPDGTLNLSGKTNLVADNGSALTYNGTPIGITDLFGSLSRISASALVYTNIFITNLPALTNNDLYTVPAGKLAMLAPGSAIIASTTNATATSCIVLVKTNGNYFRITTFSNVATNTPIVLAPSLFVWGEGDTIALTTANAGVNVWLDLILFPTNSLLKTYRITPCTVGLNTLYTVPAGKIAFDISRTSPLVGFNSVNIYNFTGASRTNAVYRVPSGASPAANNLMISGKITANDAFGSVIVSGFLGAGESIVISPDANTGAGQVAWFTVAEIPFP